MALSEEYDGLLIDLDGVVWIGREPVPGSAEALEELIGGGMPVVFVTNNPGRPASVYAERLRGLGVPAEEEQIVTAGMVTAALAAEAASEGAGAFVIGAEAFHETVAATGLRVLGTEEGRDADVVIVSGHRGFDYEELLAATLALRDGASLFATSRDPTLPMPDGEWPGTGSILAAVETASGAAAQIGGKPERHLFELARDRIPVEGRVAMIGDRIASDIEGGRRAGLETILVLSGASTREEAEAARAEGVGPDHVLDDLAGLLE